MTHDTLEQAATDGEIDLQILDLQQRLGIRCDYFGIRCMLTRLPGVPHRPQFRLGMQQTSATLRSQLLQTFVIQWTLDDPQRFTFAGDLHKVIDRRQSLVGIVQPRSALQQTLGVWMPGCAEYVDDVAVLDHLTHVHDGHVVRDLCDHTQVMRDEQDRHAAPIPQFPQNFQNLRLDRNVQGSRRLVGNQQLRIAAQRHGDHHPLLLPARHLVRVRVHTYLRLRDPYLVE